MFVPLSSTAISWARPVAPAGALVVGVSNRPWLKLATQFEPEQEFVEPEHMFVDPGQLFVQFHQDVFPQLFARAESTVNRPTAIVEKAMT
jgi:hypothetical protein